MNIMRHYQTIDSIYKSKAPYVSLSALCGSNHYVSLNALCGSNHYVSLSSLCGSKPYVPYMSYVVHLTFNHIEHIDSKTPMCLYMPYVVPTPMCLYMPYVVPKSMYTLSLSTKCQLKVIIGK